MYGFELIPFLRFFVQIFAVVAASASLWGAVFAIKAQKEKNTDKKTGFYKLAKGAMYVFLSAGTLFLIGWWALALFVFPINAEAHEGVVHATEYPASYIQNGFNANFFWVSSFSMFFVLSMLIYLIKKRRSPNLFRDHAPAFFITGFLLLSVIICLSLFSGKADIEQAVLSLHNWHSIFTVGTVIAVDLMYIYTLAKPKLKALLYPMYPLMSIAIWTGLGMDFVTSIIASQQGFPETVQFIFNQMVVVIIILNGAMLSVRINDKLIKFATGIEDSISRKWTAIIQVSGSVSIVSWITITFLDFFDFTFALWQFFSIYIFVIAGAVVANLLIEKTAIKEPSYS
ncbi:MAG: hypothetical protein WD712_01050 [Candidatus Spechtbacterales bacterium]